MNLIRTIGLGPATTPDLVAGETSDFSSYERVNEFTSPKKVPSMPCYVRRPYNRNPNFVGRHDVMDKIDEALLPSSTGSSDAEGLRLFSLCGYGGLGKSQIAIQYSLERENDFDAIFLIQADSTNKLAKSFDLIAQALGFIDQTGDTDRVVSQNLVTEWLSDPRKTVSDEGNSADTQIWATASWLLIFDNADDLRILNDYWRLILEASTGSILVTSRDPLAKSMLTSNVGMDLMPMSTSDCSALLLKLVPQSEGLQVEESTTKLAKRIGGIPLAISQIAALIQRQDMTIEEFLAEYGEGSLLFELDKIQGLPHRDQYTRTLSTVWDLEKFSPSALSLLNVLIFLDPDEIAEYILKQYVPTSQVESWPNPENTYIEARSELLSTSLVKRNKDHKTLNLHRLVQEVGQGKLGVESARTYYVFAIKLLHSAWRFQDDRFSREDFKREEADKVLPHILAIHPRYPELGGEYLSSDQRRQFVTLLSESAW